MASHAFVRSVNQDISLKTRISVQKWSGKAHIRKRDHSPCLEYLCVMKLTTLFVLAQKSHYISNLFEQIPVLLHPIEQHFKPLFKINFRLPTQFTFGFAEVRIKDTLVAW